MPILVIDDSDPTKKLWNYAIDVGSYNVEKVLNILLQLQYCIAKLRKY
jgi:hypothetical protein